MTNLFEKKDPWGNPAALWVIALLIFLTPVAWWSVQQIRLENDVETWLPPDDPDLKVLHWSHSQFPAEERIYLTWDGSGLSDPRVSQLANKLAGVVDAEGVKRSGLHEVSGVSQPLDVIQRMMENGVDSQEAVRRLTGMILGAGPLRIRLTDQARDRLDRLEANLPKLLKEQFGTEFHVRRPKDDFAQSVVVPQSTENSSTVLPPAILSVDGSLREIGDLTHDLEIHGKGMRLSSPSSKAVSEWLLQLKGTERQGLPGIPLIADCFFVPGSPTALAVSLSESGLAEKSTTLAHLRKAAEECGIPPADLRLGGSMVAGSELNQAVKRTAWDSRYPLWNLPQRSIVLMSTLISALLAFVMVRSVRLASLCLIVALYTSFVSVAIVPPTGGSMNMVLVVMPTLLLVVALSGAIHVVNYWRHEAARNPRTATAETFRMAWLPCTLASGTTAIGLISLCSSILTPVRDFGIYSAIGTLFSLGMVLFVLPALLQIFPGRSQAIVSEKTGGFWLAYGAWLTRRPLLGASICLTAGIVATGGLAYFQTETKVIRYFPDDSRLVQDYWFIEDQLAGIVPVELIVRFDEDSQSATNLLDRLEIVRGIEEAVRQHPEISGAISLADFQPVAERPEPGAGFLANSRYNKRANTIQLKIRDGEVSGTKGFYSWAKTGGDLQKPGDHLLNSPGDELWRISAQVSIMSDASYGQIRADLEKIAQEHLKLTAGAGHVITGTVPLFLRTQQAVLESLVNSFWMAYVLMLMIMVALTRSLIGGFIAMIPNILPVTAVFGAISYAGLRVDIGTMITASIAMGIAVDGTLHFLTWFTKGVQSGLDRKQAVINALTHCGPAMWQTNAAIAVGMLVLLPAELLLISRFGWLIALMNVVALVGDLGLLAMILASPLGRFFAKGPDNVIPQESPHPEEVRPATAIPAPHLTVCEPVRELRPLSPG